MTEPGRQRIVAGVHRSAASVAALRWAAAEARLRATTLLVVHTWEPGPRRASYAILGDEHNDPAMGHSEERSAADLAVVMRAALGADDVPGVLAELARGMAERVLVERSLGAGLLVLGAAVTGPASPAGPVIRACMKSAQCPLVIITAAAGARCPVAGVPVGVS